MFGSIRSRLIYGTLALALIPLVLAIAALGYISYRQASQALENRLTEQLDSLRTVKAAELTSYFGELQKTMVVLSETPTIKQGYSQFKSAFGATDAALTLSADEMRAAVARYFTEEFVGNYKVRNGGASVDMAGIVASLPDAVITMQYLYIANNPNKLGEKNKLDSAGDASAYTQAHEAFQKYSRSIIEQFGFYDIFLVDNETGNIIYTYFKEADFGTSLVDGPYAGTNIGDAFLAARDAEKGTISLTDFQTYLPSYDDPAAFLSIPVFDGDVRLGTLITQVPIDRINSVMTFNSQWSEAGLGQSGQVYVVGRDGRGRSLLRNLIENQEQYLARLKEVGGIQEDLLAGITARKSNVGLLPEPLSFIEAMAGGQKGTTRINHPVRGPLVASFGPFNASGLEWGIVSEFGEGEALVAVNSLLRNIGILALGLLGVLGILGFLLANRLAKSVNEPIQKISGTVAELSGGNFDARTRLQSSDELGQLSSALDTLLDDRVAALNQQAKENEQLNNSIIEIMQAVGQLSQRDLTVKVPVTADVTGTVADAINLMTSETTAALRQVFSISANVAQASSRVKQRSDAVLAMAEQSGTEVGAASDELAEAGRALARIAEDAQNANKTAEQAIAATQEALKIVSETAGGVTESRDTIRETEKRLKRLTERSQEISSVVGIISNIAERTSILALNASMQAVSAGEAGRGFAVVADEVKRLAENARDATQQISNLVSGIQADAVDAMQAMNSAISQVVDISRLAEQAGQQMQTTRESTDRLVRSVKDIAELTTTQSKVSDTLIRRADQISQSTRNTLEQVNQQNEESARLLQFARGLLDTVRQFKLPSA